MRVVLSVVALAVAASALVMASLSGGGERQGQGSDEVARLKVRVSALERGEERVSALERRMTDLQKRLDRVLAEVADMRAAVASYRERSSPKSETSPSRSRAGNAGSAARAAMSGQTFRRVVHRVVKEELQKYFEEQLEDARRQYKTLYAAEEWEKKEFGNLARLVHAVGEKLGLGREQKRAYFQILKRFCKELDKFQGRLSSRTKDWIEIHRKMEAKRKELLERMRSEVESLLDPQQCAKYRKLIEEKDSFFQQFP